MTNFSLIHSKQDLIIAMIPAAADAVNPHGPRIVKNSYIDLLIADVVKEISSGIADRALAKKALDISKKMASQSSNAMVASWEPGDDICPPWPFPWPGPWPLAQRGPHPEPWKPVRAAEQIELAHTLTKLAGVTTNKEFNGMLKSLANGIAGSVTKTLVDDFERCGTVPRKPLPRPKAIRSQSRDLSVSERAGGRGMTPVNVE